MKARSSEELREKVREGYGEIARNGGGCCKPPQGGASASGCCSDGEADTEALARAVGYSEEELESLPEGANMGLSCGNPNALAAIRKGEVILDLGSGGGFDAFLAGARTGPTGHVIGVDMTADMLALARRNTRAYEERNGLANVEFRLGEIEHLPVADASVDVVISNCVINLSPNKPQVWREIARVLKPGGRVAVSDMALLKPLPERVQGMVEALIGCIAGAVMTSETERMAREAGLTDIELVSRPRNLDGMAESQRSLYREVMEALPEDERLSDYVTSLEVSARGPRAPAR